jgi:hypothetical protein
MKPARYLGWGLTLLPIVVFVWFWQTFLVDVPYRDDIGAVLKALVEWQQATTWQDALTALTQQHDERRIIVSRLVALLIYQLQESVDFELLRVAGLLVIGLITYLLWQLTRRSSSRWLSVLPITYLIFQLQYHEGFFYGIVPTQYFMVIALAMLSFYWLLRESSWWWLGALLAALLALASDTVGVFVLAIGSVVLLGQRRYGIALFWLAASILAGFVYFHHFSIPPYRPSIVQNLLRFPHLVAADFLAMLGGYFDPGADAPLLFRGFCTVGMGTVVLLIWFRYLIQWWNNWRRSQTLLYTSAGWLFCWCCMAFLCLTAAAFAAARASEGFEAVLLSRYKLTSTIIVAITYLSLLLTLPVSKHPFVARLTLLLAVAVWLHSYFYQIPRVAEQRKDLLTDAFSWPAVRLFPSSPVYLGIRAKVDSILVNSSHLKLYTFESAFTANPTFSAALKAASLVPQHTPDVIFIAGNGLNESILPNQSEHYLYLRHQSTGARYLFPLYFKRYSALQFLRTGAYLSEDFGTHLLRRSLPSGSYEAGIWQRHASGQQIGPPQLLLSL